MSNAQVDAQNITLFKSVDVFDGMKKIESTNVLIVDDKIDSIGKEVVAPENATTIDGAGKTLMPGMIDCHTMFGLNHICNRPLFLV